MAISVTPTRDMEPYRAWLRQEFQPLTLATPNATLDQMVENAIRYWNTHSGFKITTMIDYPTGTIRAQLNTQFKSVVRVFPAETTTWIWNDHPLWTLLGITVIDNVTGDLIMMSEAFRNYRAYVGTDMRWTFDLPKVTVDNDSESSNAAAGGFLYVVNVPRGSTKLAVMGTKRITADEDIASEYILEWVLRYSKALVKQVEGNTLRKSSIINVKNDGPELYTEGANEMKDLQEQLKADGRWVAFCLRG